MEIRYICCCIVFFCFWLVIVLTMVQYKNLNLLISLICIHTVPGKKAGADHSGPAVQRREPRDNRVN